MAKHSNERSYSNVAMLTLLCLSTGASGLFFHTASAQQQQRLRGRPAATETDPLQRTPPDTTSVGVPSPAIDKTSALGQALAACNQEIAVQEAFTLPGLKGDVTLDRCYKGRAHLICVFTALSTEAKSLTNSYTKIVDAKYPDLTTVDGVCQLNPETLATDIVGSEDFAKRFKELKSQYEAATNCTHNVEEAFKNVTLADMAQAPEVLKSMTASIDGDLAKASAVHTQISDLALRMDSANRAMKSVTKIHRAMCMKANATGN